MHDHLDQCSFLVHADQARELNQRQSALFKEMTVASFALSLPRMGRKGAQFSLPEVDRAHGLIWDVNSCISSMTPEMWLCRLLMLCYSAHDLVYSADCLWMLWRLQIMANLEADPVDRMVLRWMSEDLHSSSTFDDSGYESFINGASSSPSRDSLTDSAGFSPIRESPVETAREASYVSFDLSCFKIRPGPGKKVAMKAKQNTGKDLDTTNTLRQFTKFRNLPLEMQQKILVSHLGSICHTFEGDWSYETNVFSDQYSDDPIFHVSKGIRKFAMAKAREMWQLLCVREWDMPHR